jgi:WD40 repeat protein
VGGPLKQWSPDIPSLQAAAMIDGRADSVWVAAYSPDRKTLFVGGREKRFEIWDLSTKQILVSRDGHGTTRCAAFSPDGHTLATGGDDGKVFLWDAQTGERKTEFLRHPGAVSAVVYTSDGLTLVSACDGGIVKLWNTKTGAEQGTWREHQRQIYCASISPDDRWLLTGGGDWTSDARGELIVWELATGRVRAKLDGHRLAVWAVEFTPDGKRFAASCSSGEAKVWDSETLQEVTTLKHKTWTRGLDFSPDGKTLAVGQGDGSVRLWDTTSWKQNASLDGHESFTFFLQFAPDGNTLATSGNDGTVRFWPVGLQ